MSSETTPTLFPRSKINKFFSILLLTGLFSAPGFSYDIDTHFQFTYFAARWAGIDHRVASQLATADQWIDVSKLTTPMGSLLIGTRLRRLFHFPGSREGSKTSAHGSTNLRIITYAETNHPIASELIMEGMKTGNLMLVGAGLHVLQDSYGHAGYTAELGHATAGHWPDRPWPEIPKYKEMVKTLMKAMVAIRQLLPEEALDKEALISGSDQTIRNAQELAESFLGNRDIMKMISNDLLRDARYTRVSVPFLIKDAYAAGYFNPEIPLQAILPPASFYDQHKDTRELLTEFITTLLENQYKTGEAVINIEKVRTDIIPGLDVEEIKREGGVESLVRIVVTRFTKRLVPEEPSTTHKNAFEKDGDLRDYETALRLSDWQDLTQKFFGNYMQFAEKKLVERVKEAMANFKAKRQIKNGQFTTLGTDIPFPLNPAIDLAVGVQADNTIVPQSEVITMSFKNRMIWIYKILKFTWFDILSGKSRFTPNPDNMTYQSPRRFAEMIRQGLVKPLVTEKSLGEMSRPNAQAASEAHMTCRRIRSTFQQFGKL